MTGEGAFPPRPNDIVDFRKGIPMFQIALIGAGRIGKIHAANIAANGRLSLSRVVDPFGGAEELARLYGARVSSIEDVWSDPAISGVVIASATDTHLNYTLESIRAGKHVFCEKPLDQDAGRAAQVEQALIGSDRHVLLGFNRRFDPSFASLQRRLKQGEIGELETLHIISHDPAPPPVSYVAVSGGIFKDMAIHDFDMASWLLGEEIESVFASASVLIDPEIGAAGDFDTAKIMLRTASGKLCVISNSRRSGYGYDQRIEAFGSKGLIRAENKLETSVQTWTQNGAMGDCFQNFFLDRYADAYASEVEHFADIIEGKSRPLADERDGVRALILAEAADRSARHGSVVMLRCPD